MSDMDPKYIVWDTGFEEIIEVFPTTTTHIDRANRLRLENNMIVSAGFFHFTVDNHDPVAYCYGDSKSLKKQSRQEDNRLLNQLFRTGEFAY